MRSTQLRFPTLILAFLAAATVAGPARAQSPAERSQIESFRDSLIGIRDSLDLLRVERRMIDLAKADRNNTVQHLKLGFVSLRLGELGGRPHYDDAASEFQWSIDLKPDWPYPWYGMGLAEYGVGDSEVSIVAGIATMLGKDALTRSAMAFAKSASVDPSFANGLVELANTALRQRVNIKLNVALDALRRSGGTPAGQNPEVQLARGRVEREVGDVDSALAAFRGYAAKGNNRGLGLLEVARTELIMGRGDGPGHYYEGAAIDDSTSVADYRRDLALIASDSALKAFDDASGPARVEVLRRFWNIRDASDLQPAGARLAEHYRRLSYARRNFFLATTNRHYDIVERYRSGNRDYDDRGIIYIRHGAPNARASFVAPNVESNESWRYTRADGDLIFHFVAREDVQDYKLVESVLDVLGFTNAVNIQDQDSSSSALSATVQDLLHSREALSPMYSQLQRVGRASAGRYQNEERRFGRESMRRGTSTDSYELAFAKSITANAEVLAVGHEHGDGLLHITYAVAGSSLDPVKVARGNLYTVRVRLAAFDANGKVVATLDTTRRVVAAQPVPSGEHLVGRVSLAVPPGELNYRLAIQTSADAGAVLPLDKIRVISVGADQPRLSDVVLGSRRIPATWIPEKGDTVFFNPLRTFTRGEEMQLYYEVAGLTAGGTYTTEVAVRKGKGGGGFFKKVFGGGGAAIAAKFDEPVAAPTASLHRTIILDKLQPGAYTLEVTITDGQGRSDKRMERFDVTK